MTTMSKAAALLTIALTVLAAAEDAFAAGRGRSGGARAGQHSGRHHHHVRSPVFVGGLVAAAPVWPWYAYAPYAPYAPAAAAPLQYIERSDAADTDWLYCRQTNTYFPYATECGGGWERVQPHPPQ
jgi:hypothetical protein